MFFPATILCHSRCNPINGLRVCICCKLLRQLFYWCSHFVCWKNAELDALEANMEFKSNSVPSCLQEDKERSRRCPKLAAGTSLARMSLIRFDCDSCVYHYKENDGLMSFSIQSNAWSCKWFSLSWCHMGPMYMIDTWGHYECHS
jgi:hypothetical protein